MTKGEIKQFIKQRLCRSPALTYYLESNHIYGRYVTKATNFFYKEHTRATYYDTDGKIKNYITRLVNNVNYPLFFIPELSKYDISRESIEDIYNH